MAEFYFAPLAGSYAAADTSPGSGPISDASHIVHEDAPTALLGFLLVTI